ncbi:MAG: ATP-binding protein [Candidatus Omnitrophota bacterium]
MNIQFKKAEKKNAKIRMAFIGPSGSGKTYSALRVASGMGGRIAFIDTERGRGSLYADKFNYEYVAMEPPYSLEKYIEYLKAAEEAGFNILIIDSLSHAWAGEGGLLEFVDNVKKSGAGKNRNEFSAWADATPKQNRMIDVLMGSQCHVLATMRTKTAYEMEEKNGKKVPVKIGLAPIQRDGVEYEFTLVADLSIDGHLASFSKDNTSLFDNQRLVPDETMGQKLIGWINETPITLNEEFQSVIHSIREWICGGLKEDIDDERYEDLWREILNGDLNRQTLTAIRNKPEASAKRFMGWYIERNRKPQPPETKEEPPAKLPEEKESSDKNFVQIDTQAVFEEILNDDNNQRLINELSGNPFTPISRAMLYAFLKQFIPEKDRAIAARKAKENPQAFLEKFSDYIAKESAAVQTADSRF